MGTQSPEAARIAAQVARNVSVEGSAVTVINGQAARLRDLADKATELEQLKDDLNAEADQLEASAAVVAAAVVANTPAAPATPVVTIGGPNAVGVGGSIALSAVASDGTPVVWSSSDTSIATVDSAGNVQGVSFGVATITATTTTASANAQVNVG